MLSLNRVNKPCLIRHRCFAPRGYDDDIYVCGWATYCEKLVLTFQVTYSFLFRSKQLETKESYVYTCAFNIMFPIKIRYFLRQHECDEIDMLVDYGLFTNQTIVEENPLCNRIYECFQRIMEKRDAHPIYIMPLNIRLVSEYAYHRL